MHQPAQSAAVFRFGSFEFDSEAGELRKRGLRLRLPGQPVQVLRILLERAGELVTRDEIKEALWASDTFVEFEHGVNAAVMRLRETLGDSPANPHYIETVPRRGYRFIAPVAKVDAACECSDAMEVTETSFRLTQPANSPVRWPRYFALSVVVVVVGTLYFLKSEPPKLEVAGSAQITSDGRVKLRVGNDPAALVTDGSRIYFTEQPISVATPRQVSTAGGESVPLITPFAGVYILDISRSGSELLIAEQSGGGPNLPLWILSLPGGSLRRLGGVLANGAGFSPDGGQIVYTTVDELYRIARDGKEPQRLLVRKDFFLHTPRWSPDGSRIRFSMEDPRTDSSQLWEVRVDGGQLHAVLPGQADRPRECCGSWTEDGKWFVFLRAAQKTRCYCDGGDVWALREKGVFRRAAEPIQLTNGPLRFRRVVSDPSGKRLFVLGRQRRSELVRYDVHSGRLTPILPELSILWANFSRDGQWITYLSEPEGTLWRGKVDGTDRQQLTYAPMRAYLPQWSPDGRRIAFVGIEVGRPWKIYVGSAQDGKLEQVTDGTIWDADPHWSADGSSLVFGRWGPNFDPQAQHAMVINRVDVGNKQVSVVPGSNGLRSPTWSPSGRYISASTEDMSTLMLFDSRTQKWRQLANVVASFPHWSRDERYIYFVNGDAEKQPAILRVRIPDGTVERIMSLQAIRSPLGFAWSGLAPDGSPTTVRDVGTEDIYSLELRER